MEIQVKTKIDIYDKLFKEQHNKIIEECKLVSEDLSESKREIKFIISMITSKKSEDIITGYDLLVNFINKLNIQQTIGITPIPEHLKKLHFRNAPDDKNQSEMPYHQKLNDLG
jgi:hypothetical protein